MAGRIPSFAAVLPLAIPSTVLASDVARRAPSSKSAETPGAEIIVLSPADCVAAQMPPKPVPDPANAATGAESGPATVVVSDEGGHVHHLLPVGLGIDDE